LLEDSILSHLDAEQLAKDLEQEEVEREHLIHALPAPNGEDRTS
jgi:hypothetical protein